MTAPKKKPAAKKPAAKKPAAKPAPRPEAKAPGEIPPVPKTPEEQIKEAFPPKPEPAAKSKAPGHVTKTSLDGKNRKALIEDFNKTFDTQFADNTKDVRVLKNMQNRLLTQKYNK